MTSYERPFVVYKPFDEDFTWEDCLQRKKHLTKNLIKDENLFMIRNTMMHGFLPHFVVESIKKKAPGNGEAHHKLKSVSTRFLFFLGSAQCLLGCHNH